MTTTPQTSEKTASLKVLEAYTRDVGRGVARIDYDTMDSLGLHTGLVISIDGKRYTVAKCLPLYPTDEGRNVIRIDSITRQNAQVSIGDNVTIKKVKAVTAYEIVIKPVLPNITPQIETRYIADTLNTNPLVLGDIIIVPYFGGRVQFETLSTNPNGPVIVTSTTMVTIVGNTIAAAKHPDPKYQPALDSIRKAKSEVETKLLKLLETNPEDTKQAIDLQVQLTYFEQTERFILERGNK